MSDPSSIPLAVAVAGWLADARFRALSPVTVAEYARVAGRLAAFLEARLGRPPTLADLAPAGVRDWLASRRLGPAGRAAYLRALRALAGWAAAEYRLAERPLAGLRPPRVVAPRLATFTPDQLRALLEGASPPLAYAVTLLAETGLRASEACALGLDDVADGWLVVRSGKGGRGRELPMSPLLRRATSIYLERIRPAYALAGEERLLVGRRGRGLSRAALYHAVARLGARVGLRGVRVSPHTFRHGFARAMARDGTQLFVLAELLGHRSLEMVRRYAPPSAEELAAEMEQRSPLALATAAGWGRTPLRRPGAAASAGAGRRRRGPR